MNEEENILETGIWCGSCGFFEDSEEMVDGLCHGCGCPNGSHVAAKVVEA